jgi:hypothetical protein
VEPCVEDGNLSAGRVDGLRPCESTCPDAEPLPVVFRLTLSAEPLLPYPDIAPRALNVAELTPLGPKENIPDPELAMPTEPKPLLGGMPGDGDVTIGE